MRATFYARVSTNSEDQKKSISSQIRFFKEYIENKKHHTVECGVFAKHDGTLEATRGYYVDEGFSGAKAYKYRFAFQQMLKDAHVKKFDIIFVKDIKRFGRNLQETLKYIGDLKELGIGVYFDNIDAFSLNHEDMLKIQLFAMLAENESTSKGQSVQWGKNIKYKDGIWGGRAPYGYNFKDGKLVKNEEEVLIVQEVFDLYLNKGMGVYNIAKTLNSKNTPTKRGAAVWNQSLISKMLKNAVYTGEIRLHRTKKIDINRNIVEKVPLEEQIVLQDESIRVVSDEIFQLTQVEKAKRLELFGDFKYKNTFVEDINGNQIENLHRTLVRGNSRHSNKHLFSNLLKCGNCGGSLRRRVTNNKMKNNRINTYTYWFCRNSELHGKTKCAFRNVQHENNLIEFVKKEIINYRSSPLKRKYYLDTILRTRYNTKDIEKKKIKLQKEIDEINIDKHGLIKSIGRELITEDEFLNEKKKLDVDLFKAESKLQQLIYIDNEISSLNEQFNRFTTFLEQVDVDNLTNGVLRKIVHKITAETHDEPIFPGATLEEKTLDIEWNFLDTTEKEILSESFKRARKLTTNSEINQLTDEMIEKLADEATRRPTEDEILWNLEKYHEIPES